MQQFARVQCGKWVKEDLSGGSQEFQLWAGFICRREIQDTNTLPFPQLLQYGFYSVSKPHRVPIAKFGGGELRKCDFLDLVDAKLVLKVFRNIAQQEAGAWRYTDCRNGFALIRGRNDFS
jgi:hypothetical protein